MHSYFLKILNHIGNNPLLQKFIALFLALRARVTSVFALARGFRKKVGGIVLILFWAVFPAKALAMPLLIAIPLWTGITALVAWGGKKALDAALGKVADAVIWLMSMIFTGAQLFMFSMGYMLDAAIIFTINSDVYKQVTAIKIGWTAVRDFSNMFFIFVLLYIAILTVLGMAGSNAKRWVAHLIIAALLINFSLFVTQVVVDAGNVLAVGFWDKIQTKQGAKIGSSATASFLEGFRIQTTVDDGKDNTNTGTGKPIEQDKTKMFLIYAGGTVVNLIAGYVFLAGAIMMIIRSVTIMILMIASPFAFLGFALPKGGGFANQWLDKLIGATFVAPVFIFMLYIDSLIISNDNLMKGLGADKAKSALAFAGNADNFPIIFNFIVMVILLLASLTVAQKVSSGVGSSAGKWAKAGIGGGAAATFVGAAVVGRQAGGRIGKMTAESTALQNMAKSNNRFARMVGNAGLKTGSAMKDGTWDIRNAPMKGMGLGAAAGVAGVNLGQASKKTYAADGGGLGVLGGYRGTANEAEILKTAKERFPNNPEAQQRYIQDKLGKQYTKKPDGEYAVDRHKDTRTELQKKMAEVENTKNFKEGVKEGKENNDKLTALKKQRDELEKQGLTADAALIKEIGDTAEALKPANEKVKRAMRSMTGEDVAKLMNKEEYRSNAGVMEGLSGKDRSAINKYFIEGKYKESMGNKDGEMMKQITLEALRGENVPDSDKRTIKNAMKNGTWGHEIDFKKELDAKLDASASDKEISETWAMLDNEDKADLKETLLHERIAERLDGATLGAIGKKGNDGVYDNVPDFRDRLQDLHTRGVLGSKSARNGRNTAIPHIDKNSTKQESYYFGMTKSTQPGGNTSGGAATSGQGGTGGTPGGGTGGTPAGTGGGNQPQPVGGGNAGTAAAAAAGAAAGAAGAAQPTPVPTPPTPPQPRQQQQAQQQQAQPTPPAPARPAAPTRIVNKAKEIQNMKNTFPPNAKFHHDGNVGYAYMSGPDGKMTGSRVTFQQDGSIGAVTQLPEADAKNLRIEAVKQDPRYLAIDQQVAVLQQQMSEESKKDVPTNEVSGANLEATKINNENYFKGVQQKIQDLRKTQQNLLDSEKLTIANEEMMNRSKSA